MGRSSGKPKAKVTRKKKRNGGRPLIPEDTQRDIVAVLLLGLAVLTVVALLVPAGPLGEWWKGVVQGLFG